MNERTYAPRAHRTPLRVVVSTMRILMTLYLFCVWVFFAFYATGLGIALMVARPGYGDLPQYPEGTFFFYVLLVFSVWWILIAAGTRLRGWFEKIAWLWAAAIAIAAILSAIYGLATYATPEGKDAIGAGAIWMLCAPILAAALGVKYLRVREWRPLHRLALRQIHQREHRRERRPASLRRRPASRDPWLVGEEIERPLEPVYEATEKIGVDVRLSDNVFQLLFIPVFTAGTILLGALFWGAAGAGMGFLVGLLGGMLLSGGIIAVRRRHSKRQPQRPPTPREPTVASPPPPKEPPPMSAPRSTTSENENYLQLLTIFHYVVAGLTAVFASLPLFHVLMGLLVLVIGASSRQAPPAFIGIFFILVGGVFVVLGWTLAICIFVAGRKLAQRTHWTYCLVVGGIECLFMPIGTVLGVFTIIVLMKDEVKEMFGVEASTTCPQR